jgi:predicted ATPase with chaperone activity
MIMCNGGRFQTAVTTGIANLQLIDGIDLQIQEPSVCAEETYLKATEQERSTQMAQVCERVLEVPWEKIQRVKSWKARRSTQILR